MRRIGPPAELELRLTLARSSNRGIFTLDIEDVRAGVRFVEVAFDAEQFADLLSTRPVETSGAVRLAYVGKVKEYKELEIDVPHVVPGIVSGSPAGRTEIRAVLATYEVDGWQARDADVWNPHRVVHYATEDRPRRVRVGFDRWVDPPEDPGDAGPRTTIVRV